MFGYGAGGIILTQLQTNYINPKNISPDESSDNEKYYSMDQKQVLDRIPSIFLVLVCVYAALQIVGLCLIIDEDPKVIEANEQLDHEDDDDENGSNSHQHPINISKSMDSDEVLERLPILASSSRSSKVVNSIGIEYINENN